MRTMKVAVELFIGFTLFTKMGHVLIACTLATLVWHGAPAVMLGACVVVAGMLALRVYHELIIRSWDNSSIPLHQVH